jgi:hypothetical protein
VKTEDSVVVAKWPFSKSMIVVEVIIQGLPKKILGVNRSAGPPFVLVICLLDSVNDAVPQHSPDSHLHTFR